MGRLIFSKHRPSAPLELLVGLSAIVRGLYLLTINLLSTTFPTDDTTNNFILAALFCFFGIVLSYGVVTDTYRLRLLGLIFVGLGTLSVIIRTIHEAHTVIISVTGNITLLVACVFLILVATLREHRE